MRFSACVLRWSLLSCLLCTALGLRADALDDAVAGLMAKRHIPGLSLAIVQDGKIVKAQGYGVVEQGRPEPVTADTLFQAGSVSKAVVAMGALVLVEKGKLSLDGDINASLVSWKIPDNTYTRENRVTLRRLLSHTAGVTVHGFPGYAADQSTPTLRQVLDGRAPANTPPIRVDMVPGTKWRYSGGGYTVVQQCIIDVTDQRFPEYMRTSVLQPLQMSASSYEQPLPQDRVAQTATGHIKTKAVEGRWHVYPEMAAAGLWTTPSDLARFVIGIQDSLAGRSNPVLSKALTRQMATVEKDDVGLGLFLSGKDPYRRFGHNGRDEGFDANMVGYLESGQGAVVMINTNDDTNTLGRVFEVIAETYHWPDYIHRDASKPIEDKEPAITAQVRSVLEQLRSAKINAELFTSIMAKRLQDSLVPLSEQLEANGAIKAVDLLARQDVPGHRVYRYRVTFENEVVVIVCGYDPSGKIDGLLVQPD